LRKKNILVALNALVLLGTLSIAFGSTWATFDLTVISTSSSTDVSGYITTNTTWTLAGSPYVVTADVVVVPNVFLTIEPGVVVKFANGTNLIIDGVLIAQGNSTHIIMFTSNATTPSPGDWGGIRFRDSSIDYASIIEWVTCTYSSEGISFKDSSQNLLRVNITKNSYGIYFDSGVLTVSISDSNIYDNAYGLLSGGYWGLMGSTFLVSNSNVFSNTYGFYGAPHSSFLISNSKIYFNSYGLGGGGGSWSINNSEIHDNTYGMGQEGDGSSYAVYNSAVYNNVYGVYIYGAYAYYGSASVLNCSIFNNAYGIYGYGAYGSLTISKSSIFNNSHLGVSAPGPLSIKFSSITSNGGNGIEASKGGYVHYSNIHGNTLYDVKLTSADNLNATYNWWGTTNATEIEQHIYDYFDDYNLGMVYYQPFLDTSVAIPPVAHDVAITSLTAYPTNITAGESVYINASVANEGDFYETFNVTIYYDSVQIGKSTVWLGWGQNQTLWFYWYTYGVPSGNYTISAEVSVVPSETDTEDNIFIDGQVEVIGPPPPPPQPPYAYFTYSPYYPSVGDPVTFDASYSWDPDGHIVDYIWNYGDNTTGRGKITTHTYNASGTSAVILRVVDDDGLNGTTIQYITVLPPMLVHDIAVTDVKASPTRVIPGDLVTITVTVENQGDFTETFTVTTFYDNTIAAPSQTVTDLAAGASTTLNFTWNTTGIPVGDTTIKAEAGIVPGEGDIGDNTFINGKVTLAHRTLSIELSGDFDYLLRETVRIKLAALVKDALTMEPVSNANVTIKIYDDVGNLWISSVMVEKLPGTGIYEWQSSGTIKDLGLKKGIYLVRAQASYRGGPIAQDILLFHIDPPAEGTNEVLYYIAYTVVALASITGLFMRRRQIINKLRR